MSTGIDVDPRLLPLVEIDEPTRQHVRRVAHKRPACKKCGDPVTPETVVLVNGNRDAHRHCAEVWNVGIFDAWDELRAKDEEAAAEARAKAFGLAVPTGGDLWVPPKARRPLTATK